MYIREIITFVIVYLILIIVLYDILTFYTNYKNKKEVDSRYEYLYFRDYLEYFMLKKKYKVIKKDSPIHGQGLFAAEDIPANSFIIVPKNSFGVDEVINDATFKYPTNFTYDELKNNFKEYVKDMKTNSKSNVRVTSSLIFPNFVHYRSIKFIPRGTELTYDYGIDKWFKYLLNDISGCNPFEIMNKIDANLKKMHDSKYININELVKNLAGIPTESLCFKSITRIGNSEEKQKKLDALIHLMNDYNYVPTTVIAKDETNKKKNKLFNGKTGDVIISELARCIAA